MMSLKLLKSKTILERYPDTQAMCQLLNLKIFMVIPSAKLPLMSITPISSKDKTLKEKINLQVPILPTLFLQVKDYKELQLILLVFLTKE
jgi:hypothetical protein